MLFRIYGKIIISQEAQKEFLFLVPNHMLLPFLVYSLQNIVIQEASSSQDEFCSMSRFYIVDSTTNMLFTINMNVMMILHRTLMMATRLMPLILIRCIPVKTADALVKLVKPSAKSKKKSSPLDDIREDPNIQKMNCPLKHLLQITHITPTIRNYLVMMKKTLLIQQKIDSPICLACTTAKMLQCLPLVKSQLLCCLLPITREFDDAFSHF